MAQYLTFEPINHRNPSQVDIHQIAKIERSDWYSEIIEKNGRKHQTKEDINRLYTRLNYLLRQAKQQQADK